MRHLIANVASYVIAVLLIGGAALFAWMRSAQLVFSDEESVRELVRPAEGEPFAFQKLGAESYASNCANCHGQDGQGWDQYPSVNQAPNLFALPGGRAYLVDVHLYGLTSDRTRAPMPPMGHMPDVELAAVLNHVLVSFGNALPEGHRVYRPEDVEARRGQALTPDDVNRRRAALLAPP